MINWNAKNAVNSIVKNILTEMTSLVGVFMDLFLMLYKMKRLLTINLMRYL